MAQTQDGKTWRSAEVNIGADSSMPTSLDGIGAAVAVSGGSWEIATQNTLGDDEPVVEPNAKEPTEVEVRFIYTENSSDPFEVSRAIFQGDDPEVYMEWLPLGTGNNKYQTAQSGSLAAGIMRDFVWPEGDRGAADIIMGGFTVVCTDILKA